MKRISRERASRIAKAHPCEICKEYSYKRVSVKPATASQKKDLGIEWAAEKVCGVCDAHHELGIDAEGEIVYVS